MILVAAINEFGFNIGFVSTLFCWNFYFIFFILFFFGGEGSGEGYNKHMSKLR